MRGEDTLEDALNLDYICDIYAIVFLLILGERADVVVWALDAWVLDDSWEWSDLCMPTKSCGEYDNRTMNTSSASTYSGSKLRMDILSAQYSRGV